MQESKPPIAYAPTLYTEAVMLSRSKAFYDEMRKRRSIREFSAKHFPLEILENIILTAGTAPSGANKQPWRFCVVSDPAMKRQIREAAEKEEYKNYHGRMSATWMRDLEQFGTNEVKEFLEIAPYLIVVFKQAYSVDNQGGKSINYYVNESVGIAVGMLLTAIHHAGLCALTHTPSPMNFLEKLLNCPENERAYLLIPVGYPAEKISVPDIEKKDLESLYSLCSE